MLNKKIIACIAVLLAVMYMAEAREENPHDMADTLRMLQELDRYYSQAARPRMTRSVDYENLENFAKNMVDERNKRTTLINPRKKYRPPRISRRDYGTDRSELIRAIRLWQLDELNKKYGKNRPRFGKRSETYNWAKDVEKPDIPAWLAYARRR